MRTSATRVYASTPSTSREFIVPYQREADVVLGMWREVQRELATIEHGLISVEPASPEAARLDAENARLIDEWALLRAEHHRLVEAARLHHRPEPVGWPERSLAEADIADLPGGPAA